MNKNNILERIEKEIVNGLYIRKRIIIFYKNDFSGIIHLKKELRKLTKKYDDFYKRNNGFYNKNIDIFICPEYINIDTFNSIVLFANNEEESKEIATAIIEFINIFYKTNTYYNVIKSYNGKYDIKQKILNEYEYIIESQVSKIHFKVNFGIFKTKEEAVNKILEKLNEEISEKETELNLLKQMKEKYIKEQKNS